MAVDIPSADRIHCKERKNADKFECTVTSNGYNYEREVHAVGIADEIKNGHSAHAKVAGPYDSSYRVSFDEDVICDTEEDGFGSEKLVCEKY